MTKRAEPGWVWFGLVLRFVFVVVFVCFLSKSHQHTENPVNVF